VKNDRKVNTVSKDTGDEKEQKKTKKK